MANKLTKILALLNDLNDTELGVLEQVIQGRLDPIKSEMGRATFRAKCAEERFSDGLVYPHCSSKHINKHSKYGKRKDKQRYFCVDCKRTFSLTTKTIFYKSKLPVEKWIAYADCMTKNKAMSLRDCADEVGVCLKTAFYMRHKLLSALTESIGIDHLGGIIEMDETFLAESFKGNHNRQYNEGKATSHNG